MRLKNLMMCFRFRHHKPQILNIGASEFCIKYKNILEVLCLRYMLDQGSVNFL